MLQRFRPAGKLRFRSGSGSVFRRMEVACEARTGAYAQHLKWLTSTAPAVMIVARQTPPTLQQLAKFVTMAMAPQQSEQACG